MAPRFDPLGLADLAQQTLRTGVQVAWWSQRQVVGLLRGDGTPAPEATGPQGEGLDAKMLRLLDRTADQGSTSSRQELFGKILDQIVPDEARIVEALSDGSAAPLVNVYAPTSSGLVGEVVLENMSLVGKTANLALPQLTPTYVSHLLSLGLLETGPEDAELSEHYERLAADTAVLRAIKRASGGPLPAQLEKRTLRLSGLGIELWSAASGD